MKKYNWVAKASLAALLLAGPAVRLHAQEAISVSEEAKIKERAKDRLKTLFRILNTISDPNEDVRSTIEATWSGSSSNHIALPNTPINSDLYPSVSSNSESMDIGSYLDLFHRNFKQQFSPTWTIVTISDIKKGADNPYLNVTYVENFSEPSKDSVEKPYHERKRVAQMQAYNTANGWECYISSISFYDTSDKSMTLAENIPVKKDVGENIVANKNEDYYKSKFDLGTLQRANRNYIDAYIAFKDCGLSNTYRADANKAIEPGLKEDLAKVTNYPDSLLMKGLAVKAEDFRRRNKFTDAKKCYQYLQEHRLTDNLLKISIAEMDDKIKQEKKLTDLYDKRRYNEALTAYTAALNGNLSDVSDVYAGRARCYAALGRLPEADADFAKAISLDRSNIDAYNAYGEYLLTAKKKTNEKPLDYANAYKAFATYITLYPETYQLNEKESKLAYSKGMEIYYSTGRTGEAEARDSFYAARTYDAKNVAAYNMLATCYFDEGIKDSALAILTASEHINNNQSYVHHLKGIIQMSDGNHKKYKAGLGDLEAAANTDEKNGVYNLEAGSQLRRVTSGKKDGKKDSCLHAITYFTHCIDNDPIRSASAYFNRGRCYSYLGRNAEALSDFEMVKNKYANNYVFNREYGKVLTKNQKYDEAMKCFEKAAQANANDPETWYAWGEAIYLSEPNAPDEKPYLENFKKAFAKGVPHSIVDEDAYAQQLEKKRSFKNLKIEYKYW